MLIGILFFNSWKQSFLIKDTDVQRMSISLFMCDDIWVEKYFAIY